MEKTLRNLFLACLMLVFTARSSVAQTFGFNSGPIPMCDTSYFTANVSGLAILEPPGWMGWGSFLYSVCIDITTDHPQTLVITLTSPAGTSLLLSAYNGAGGSDYTSCCFMYSGSPNITTGSAPFTGNWTAQGGSMSIFDWEDPNGNWTITVIDTACSSSGSGGWTDGWFNGSGSAGGATIGFGQNAGPPPCTGWIPDNIADMCMGDTIDILNYYISYDPNLIYTISIGSVMVADPTAVTAPGIYMIEGYDWNTGCAYVAYFTLNIWSLGPDQTVNQCSGAASVNLNNLFTLTGITPSWSLNGTPITMAIASAATTPGVYQLVGLNGTGCMDTALVTLSIGTGVSLGPNQTVNQCSGAPVNLNSLFVLTGITTSWSLNGTPISTAAASAATTPGVYQLIGQNASGCADTALVTLNISSGISLGPNQVVTVCLISGSYNLTNLFNTSGFTTNWYLNGNPVANPSAVTANGNYTIIASNAGGCADTAVVSLTIYPAPSLGPDQSVSICSGTSTNLTTLYTTGANLTSWFFGPVPIPDPLSTSTPGVYTLFVTSSNGCTDTAQVTLSVVAAPSLGPDLPQSICANTTIDLTTLFNTTGFTTSWTNNGVPVGNPGVVSTPGSYQLIASASASCSDTALVTLTNLPTPALGPDQASAICAGNTVDLTALFITTGYTVSWTLGGNPVANPAAISTAGSYQLIATSGSCSDTALAVVTVGTLPVLGPDQQVTACDNTVINLTSLYNTGGSTVSWTNNGTAVADPSAVNTAGAYMLTVTNASGCTASATVTVTMNTAPDLGPDQSNVFCSGGTLDLTSLYSLTGLTAVWTKNGSVVPDPTVITSSGNYQLIATNANGCSDTALTVVTVTAGPDLGADQSFILCPWMTVDLSSLYAITGLTVSYSYNGQPLTAYTAVHDSGTYAISVTDTNGCTDEALVTLTNIECLCVADFNFVAICMQEPVSFEIQADSALIGAHWSFGNSSIPDQYTLNPVVKFNTSNSVLVTLEASLSCGTVVVEKYLKVEDCADSCHFYIPNAFTPNNDGKNDRFTWYGECTPEEYKLEIYNRFGQLIFRSNNHNEAWDGKHNDIISPSGVYVYHVEYKLPYQFKNSVTGRISVLR